MPILIIIVLTIFAPGVLYALFQTAVFGVTLSLPLAAAGRRPTKVRPQSTRLAIAALIIVVCVGAIYVWSCQFVGGVANGWLTP